MQIDALTIPQLTYFIVFTALIGLCIGSFLNVVILRALWNEPIALPPSKCPNCKELLKWYDNIPLLSYLILKGKCRNCNQHISIQYPIIEALTAILFIFTFVNFGLTLKTLFIFIFLSLFIVLATTDMREKIIFDYHAYILAGTGLIYNFFDIAHKNAGTLDISIFSNIFKINLTFLDAILGMIVAIIIMETLARLGNFFFNKRAFGEGDSYIAGALGAILGTKFIIYALALAFALQTIFILPFYIKNLFKEKQYKLLILFFSFVILAILTKFACLTNPIVYVALVLLLCINGILITKELFKSLRAQKAPKTVPFGPAILLGGFIFLFFASKFIF